MTLSKEWKNRVELWKNELPKHYYTPLDVIGLEGYTTFDRLSMEDALKGGFQPFPPGTRWGAKWEYGWFRGNIVLPAAAEGKRIVLSLDVGGESTVFVNGRAAGCVRRYEAWQAMNPVHVNILTLERTAQAEARYELVIECYAGHGTRVAHVGPVPPGRETIPEPPVQQAAMGVCTYGIWNEEIYQLWLDVEALYQVRGLLDPNSLRVAQIDKALMDFTLLVDMELPFEEMLATAAAARQRLKPLLQCTNGTTAPEMFAFGHSHLDICYQWTLAETRRKCARTLSTQLALMDEYPGYRFLLSQPYLYEITKRDYPELYERLKEKVRNGQIMPEGAMWVEADTNIPSGESLIRQFLYGMEFFRSEFGIDSQLLWLPDVFGYTGALPQIMKGCGVKYFSTAKLLSSFVTGEPFPYNTFTWKGIDGTEVPVSLCENYCAHMYPETVAGVWNQRVQKDGVSSFLYPFGHGDGGGGATRDHLEFLRRVHDLEGVPRVKISHPVDFFEDLEARGFPEAAYVGELYFQAHRGTYTSQARMKRWNRRSETALRETELWGAAAQILQDYTYPRETMDRIWKELLFLQFHDILPGSSIHQVFVEAEESYRKLWGYNTNVQHEALSSLLQDRSDWITVFNSAGWDRRELVLLPPGTTRVADSAGKELKLQEVQGRVYTEAYVPSCGWTSLQVNRKEARPPYAGEKQQVMAGAGWLENDLLRLELNEYGELAVILDKSTGRNLAAAPCNVFRMYKDVPGVCDAWEIEVMYEQQPVALPDKASIEVVAQGALFGQLRVSRRLHASELVQTITLRQGSRRVDFETTVEWREKHKLLKVSFPVDIHTDEAMHEIQYGYVKRPNHRSRSFDADRFEVCQHRWSALAEANRGCALLNDCKYGISVLGNSMNLTLLKAALAPDMTADLGRQEFTYSFTFWNGPFVESNVIREAYGLNTPVISMEGWADERSLFAIDCPAVVLDNVKPAEDGSGDLILRLYESMGTSASCTLNTSVSIGKAIETTMREAAVTELALGRSGIPLSLRPFEVKTIRLSNRTE